MKVRGSWSACGSHNSRLSYMAPSTRAQFAVYVALKYQILRLEQSAKELGESH